MKRFILPFLGLMALFCSCNKNLTTLPSGNNGHDEAQSEAIVDTSGFTSDSLTESFILLSTKIKYDEINIGVVDSAIADDTITSVEMTQVATALGFDSKDALIAYIAQHRERLSELYDKYDLTALPKDEVKYMFSNAMMAYLNNLAKQFDGTSGYQPLDENTDPCAVTLAECVSQAYAFEIEGLVVCQAGDLFPSIAVLCVSSVVVGTGFKLAQCNSDYNKCEHPTTSSLANAVKLTFYVKTL